MKWLPGLSLFLGFLSICFSGFIVLGDDRVRAEAFAGRFSLLSQGEGAGSMAIPLTLSITAGLLGLMVVRQRLGQWGVLTGAVGLAAAFIILGRPGFEYLF